MAVYEPIRLPLADAPDECGNCGHRDNQWPLGVYGGLLNVTCPECHVIVAEVVAVAADPPRVLDARCTYDENCTIHTDYTHLTERSR